MSAPELAAPAAGAESGADLVGHSAHAPPEGAVRARGRGLRERLRPGRGPGARTQILVSYVVLLTLSAVLSTGVIREILLLRLDQRLESALQQEVLELDRLVSDGRDPETGRPFTSLESLFDVYLARNVPSDEEGLLAFVDGRLYRSTLDRFPLRTLPAETLVRWAELSRGPVEEDAEGRFETRLGEAHYHAAPVRFEEGGLFVVTILPAAELRWINELRTYGFAATFVILLLASGLAWLVTGRVLAPVRLLTHTARSISRSDLTRRVEARGGGEAAEMARSFNAMLDRLEALFRSQREFVRDASHQLRDPLTICRGHLELLGTDLDERRLTMDLVLDELERMGRMVDDLQLLADAEQPDFLRPEPIELGTFVEELVAKAGALAPRRWTVDAAPREAIVADRHRLTDAVMNLAHNAVKHTSDGDTVAIGAAVDEAGARVWVRDAGPGVAEDERARIFERFTRGRAASRRYRGAGLGLSIVSMIAEAHGGRVSLESRPGAGATFSIVLPRGEE